MSEVAVHRLEIADARARFAAFRALAMPYSPDCAAPVAPPSDPDDDYARGYAEGCEAVRKAASAERGQLQALLAAAQALQPEPSEELAALIVEMVAHLVETITGTTSVDRDTLNRRARRAVAIVAEADAARTLHLNPADLALIDAGQFPLELVADPAMPRGTLRIAASTGWIEDGVSIYLDALRDALDRKEDAA